MPMVRWLQGGALLGVAVAGWATLVERRWYALRHATLPVLSAAATAPLRLLHISDLHLVPGQRHKEDFVRHCAAQRPDLVVATGDFLGHRDAVQPAVELLAPLTRDRPGLFVLGSNDLYGPVFKNPLGYLRQPDGVRHGVRLDTDGLVRGLTDAGWIQVDNQRLVVETVAGPVDVAGLGDPHIGRDRPDLIDWTEPGTVALRLGVVHAPYTRALETFGRHGYDLVLAGHTHGGQVRVPGLGAIVDNCDLPLERARGASRGIGEGVSYERLWLHVSAGLGTSMYAPFRFACRPEASLLDLVPPQRPAV